MNPGETFPGRDVVLAAPFPEGHVADLQARMLASHVAAALDTGVTVENWVGESGTAALSRLRQADADGYTLMMHGYGGLALAPHILRVDYDPVADFAAIAKLVSVPLVLVANADLGVSSVGDLIAAARRDTERVRGGSFGNASNSRLALALFNQATGLKIPHTAYAGGFDTTAALLAGEFEVMFEFPPVVMPHVGAGRLAAVAVTTRDRLPALPDVPTLLEAGVDMVELVGWQGIIGPRGIARDIVDRLNEVFNEVQSRSAVRAAMDAMGYRLERGTAEQFQAFIAEEAERWGHVIRDVGLAAQVRPTSHQRVSDAHLPD